MIVFNLSCCNDHRFEGWFETTEKFEFQQSSKLLSCPVCGTDRINKELHAPYVNTGVPRDIPSSPVHSTMSPQQVAFKNAISELVEQVIANTEDVGDAFPEEARKIHYSEVPERPIRGNASKDEVAELREEGIEVISLPIPRHRTSKPH